MVAKFLAAREADKFVNALAMPMVKKVVAGGWRNQVSFFSYKIRPEICDKILFQLLILRYVALRIY